MDCSKIKAEDRLAKYRQTQRRIDLPVWLTTDEAGEILGKSRSSICESIRIGQIKARRMGSAFRIHRDEVVPADNDSDVTVPLTERFRRISAAMQRAGISADLISITLGYYAEAFVTEQRLA